MGQPGPLYRRIADRLREQITSGTYAAGQRLPAEPELMSTFHASRNTVRLALAALANEGLVATEHGRGTFVREQRTLTYHAARAERVDRPSSWQTDAYFEEVREAGREPSQSFTLRMEPAIPEVCARLHVDEDQLVVLRKVIRYVDGQPWSEQDSWYPMDVAEQAGLTVPHDLPGGTIRAMAQAGHVEVGYVDELTARMPTPDEIRALALASGVPVVIYARTAWTSARPVRVTRTVFPADRNRIVYELGDLSAYDGKLP
jgi:GntR family transcriptional regulator